MPKKLNSNYYRFPHGTLKHTEVMYPIIPEPILYLIP